GRGLHYRGPILRTKTSARTIIEKDQWLYRLSETPETGRITATLKPNHPINQSPNQPIYQSPNPPINQLTNHPIHQSPNTQSPINQSTNPPITPYLCPSLKPPDGIT
ncbi:MAG: hypothetical protein WBB20_05955, partial [Chitinophagaceae bacterium]